MEAIRVENINDFQRVKLMDNEVRSHSSWATTHHQSPNAGLVDNWCFLDSIFL